MAVETSSIKPTAPRKPPTVVPTKGESGQDGVPYGHNHVLSVKNPNASEMSAHFAGKEQSNEGTVSKAGKPGYK
jgi:hypothetical protein